RRLAGAGQAHHDEDLPLADLETRVDHRGGGRTEPIPRLTGLQPTHRVLRPATEDLVQLHGFERRGDVTHTSSPIMFTLPPPALLAQLCPAIHAGRSPVFARVAPSRFHCSGTQHQGPAAATGPFLTVAKRPGEMAFRAGGTSPSCSRRRADHLAGKRIRIVISL